MACFLIQCPQGLFRNYSDAFLPVLKPHMERLANDSHESTQRCVAEIIAGLVRGSKHWSFGKVSPAASTRDTLKLGNHWDVLPHSCLKPLSLSHRWRHYGNSWFLWCEQHCPILLLRPMLTGVPVWQLPAYVSQIFNICIYVCECVYIYI